MFSIFCPLFEFARKDSNIRNFKKIPWFLSPLRMLKSSQDACAAMKTDDAKVFVGYSGIYDLTTAAITTRTKDEQRKAYVFNLDPSALAKASPCPDVEQKEENRCADCLRNGRFHCGTSIVSIFSGSLSGNRQRIIFFSERDMSRPRGISLFLHSAQPCRISGLWSENQADRIPG